jgi:peptidoglycan hydrolase CwlO-like protein
VPFKNDFCYAQPYFSAGVFFTPLSDMRYNEQVNSTYKKTLFFVGIFILVAVPQILAPRIAYAQTMQCDTPAQKVACQAALNQALADQAAAQAQLEQAQGKSASLTQAVAILAAKIKVAQANIKAKNLLIQTLGSDIQDKQNHITNLEGHITTGKQSLADILRKMNELDAYSLPEVLLSQSTVAGFFNDIDTFQSVQNALQDTFDQLQADKTSTSAEKDALTTRKNTETDARYSIQQQEASIQSDQAEQKQLLSISKGNEKSYSSLVAQKAAQAAQIRAALFPLAGAKSIPFGDALNYANTVYQKLGVPPAFLLAILKQETNIGGNVGTCYLTNPSDGSGINTKTNGVIANVMKPTRDVQPFLRITSALGYDYKTTVVSCPQSIGYGGGMGPAQFIASTWVLIQDRIASSLGVDTPNPWRPLDAFMAAGIYLSDLGADSSSYTAQKNAACKYYSGGSCKTSNGSSGYASSVLALAASLQSDINTLQGL